MTQGGFNMGSATPQTPTPPTPPSASASLREWINLQPEQFAAEQEFAPQYADLYKQISEELYPQTAGLQELLAGQAATGAQEQVPDWLREEYRSNIAGQLGENYKSGIGADYASTGLLNLQKNWNDYYRTLGLSVSGRQPLATPSFQTAGFTPNTVASMNTATYSPYASAYSSMYGTNANLAAVNAQKPFQYMQGAGNLLSGIGSFIPGKG